MARMPRLVVPDFPHHVTQRGNRRQRTFFKSADYRLYTEIVAESKSQAEATILAYCLMPNHVHFVIVPSRAEGLATLFRDAHRRYTRFINDREGWRGHLWQERFHSVVMDEIHLVAAVRYVELNPVRAGLCATPEDWPWSSVHAHLRREDDELVTVSPMLDRVGSWVEYLSQAEDQPGLDRLRLHTRTGRPCGDERFMLGLEDLTGRRLRTLAPGRKAARQG